MVENFKLQEFVISQTQVEARKLSERFDLNIYIWIEKTANILTRITENALS